MLTVEYPPGGHDPVHRHNAHGFIDVLEGSIVMAVNGQQPITGYDGIDALRRAEQYSHHRSQRKQDDTCQVLGFLLKDKGTPVLTPVK